MVAEDPLIILGRNSQVKNLKDLEEKQFKITEVDEAAEHDMKVVSPVASSHTKSCTVTQTFVGSEKIEDYPDAQFQAKPDETDSIASLNEQ